MSDYVERFIDNPERAYKDFVRECNDLCRSTRHLALVAAWLRSESDPRSTETRRQLLHMPENNTPTWEDLLTARLRYDLVCPTMFRLISDPANKGNPSFLVFVDDESASDNGRRASTKEIESYLFEMLMFTAKTLNVENYFRQIDLQFKQCSLFSLFKVPPKCISYKMARAHLRSMPFHVRQKRVRFIYDHCTSTNKAPWITTQIVNKMDDDAIDENCPWDVNNDCSDSSHSPQVK